MKTLAKNIIEIISNSTYICIGYCTISTFLTYSVPCTCTRTLVISSILNIINDSLKLQLYSAFLCMHSTINMLHVNILIITIRSISCYSYILMISLEHQNKMADYLINWPFCSDDFNRSYKIIRS